MDQQGQVLKDTYILEKKIGEGGMSHVYAALDRKRSIPVVIKILKADSTSRRVEDIIRFRNEASTVSRLNVPEIVKVFEIGETDSLHFIAMEYLTGKSLHNLILEDTVFTVDETVKIILKICNALQHIHNSHVIHRDLKPGNIIISYNPGNDNSIEDVKLIDFGLAQVKEFNRKETPEIVGTFHYMSPEQCGVIKRSIDERSDLYSLGIIFYQLLSGDLPFKGESISSIIHHQIAKKPTHFKQLGKEIPAILDKIVFKLLEKEPEKRYQNAAGLKDDLIRFQKGERDFHLGADDKTEKLNYTTPLIGREDEYSLLLSKFEEAVNHKGNIFLVGGEAGRGKTRLTDELLKQIFQYDGRQLQGKCFSGKSKIPYGPFKDVLNEYITIYNKYSNEQKSRIRKHIKEHIGDLGEIILKFNPAMKDIIGTCPPLESLDRDSENSRFLTVVSSLFFLISELENILVIQLDDIQWADESTFELMGELTKLIGEKPLFLLCSYRDNEISETHSLTSFIKRSETDHRRLTNIQLPLFTFRKMKSLVSKLLLDSEDQVGVIADFIFKKSKGNPYFAIELLKELIHSHVITRKDKHWEIDNTLLAELNVPDSIIDLLMKQIHLLEDEDKEILSYTAVMGREFDMKLLFDLNIFDSLDIVMAIDRSIRFHLLESSLEARGKVQFVHDRIREAFYKIIPREKRKTIHLKIAETLEAQMTPENREHLVFDLAYHYFSGVYNEKVLLYAYPAGKKAYENFAFDEALKYFKSIITILEDMGAENDPRRLTCLEKTGEIYSVIGLTEKAVHYFNLLLLHISDKTQKLKIYREISFAYFKVGDREKCEEYCSKALGLYNITLPHSKPQLILSKIQDNLFRLLKGNSRKIILREKSEHEAIGHIIWIFCVLIWTYASTGSIKRSAVALKMINFAERHLEDSKELSLSFMVYAVFISEQSRFDEAYIYHQKALDIRTRMNDRFGMAQSLTNMGFFYKIQGEYKKSIECFKKSSALSVKMGDYSANMGAVSGLAGAYLFISDLKNARKINSQYYNMGNTLKDVFDIIVALLHNTIYYTELGDLEQAVQNGKRGYDLAVEDKNEYLACLMATVLGRALTESGEIKEAIDYLEKAKELFEKNEFLLEYSTPLFPYLAEAYVADYQSRTLEMTRLYSKNYEKKIDKACKLARKQTKNWISNHIYSLRVSAKYAALTKQYRESEDYFKESIRTARDLERQYELAVSLHDYAIFLASRNRTEDAKQTFEKAYIICKDLNSKKYEEKCAAQLGITDTETAGSERMGENIRYYQRLNSLFYISQEISSTLDLDELLRKVISKAIEVTGAERGYIMMENRDNELEMTVRKNINSSDEAIHYSTNIAWEVFSRGSHILTTNAVEDERFSQFKSVRDNMLKSILCVPIKYKDQIKGVCYLDNPLSSSVFTETDVEMLNLLMVQAAISIENARLYKLAVTDGLTELYNFRHFEILFENEIERSERYSHNVSMIMIDIDHFKNVNDTYGHHMGDIVIRRVTETISESCRRNDIVGRLGGEEFSVLFPETGLEGAQIAAEKIRKNIEVLDDIFFEDTQLKITVSIGVAVYPDHKTNTIDLRNAADTALYASKRNGRNRVSVYEPGPS